MMFFSGLFIGIIIGFAIGMGYAWTKIAKYR